MKNPWNDISLKDYENHMKLDSVGQLQALNAFMRVQLNGYPIKTAMVLGVAGGNGLEHVDAEKLGKVYGVDVNEKYLEQCAERYAYLRDVFECVCCDLTDDRITLPHVDMVIADLLVEYIGYDCFKKNIVKIRPKYVSCVIQVNTSEAFVSQSPYIHSFDGLDSVHRNIEEDELNKTMGSINYVSADRAVRELPNGKKLILLTYKKDFA